MLFNSLAFLIFFPLVTALYFLLSHRVRVWLLLVSATDTTVLRKPTSNSSSSSHAWMTMYVLWWICLQSRPFWRAPPHPSWCSIVEPAGSMPV
jgi:hypothetical protein